MATPGDKERGLPSPTQQAFPQQQQQQQQQPAAQTQTQTQQQQHQQRPSSRRFSFLSDKSRKNSASAKIDLHETHAEKDSRRLHSKADPTLAMNEAEPSVEAIMTASSRPPLRSIQHKDAYGNVIADPDLSNPTRNRWERPLDTIRSFEAAIEGDFARRSMHRSETDPSANVSRRNSYYRANQPRFPQDSYYGSRAASFRGEGSQFGPPPPMSARNSYFDNQHYSSNGGYYTSNAGPSGGRRPSREQTSRMAMASEPQLRTYGREQNVYPLPHKDRSYETVTSAAASGNSEAAGYQTDPTSSDNSSIHRTSPAKQVNDYGIAFSQSQSYKPPMLTVNLTAPASKMPTPPNASYQNPQSAIPRKDASLLKRQVSTTPSGGEKRKSWFSRRFSKNS